MRTTIQSGDLAVGALLPCERQLQEQFGVSRTTVRRALANLVASGWAETSPNRGVISRRGRPIGRSRRIAFVDHKDHVHRSLFFRLHSRMADRGFEMIHVDSQDIGTIQALWRAADEDFGGAVVWPKAITVEREEFAELQSRMPIIAVDHSIGGEASDLVMNDHAMGARQAVAHLAWLGRKRIAISGNFTSLEDAQLRFAGYMAALYEHGLPVEAHNFVFSSPQQTVHENPRLLQFRLGEEDRPDAVFVLHDMSVPSIAETILDSGHAIPSDIAVVGFGNDLPFMIDGVGLTTVGMNWDSVAQAILDRLILRVEHPTSPYRRVLIPTNLIVRGSCGAPRDQWSSQGYEASSATITSRLLPGNEERFSVDSSRFQALPSGKVGGF